LQAWKNNISMKIIKKILIKFKIITNNDIIG